MERKSQNNVEIDLFSADELAEYIERFFSNDKVKNLITSAKNINQGRIIYSFLGEFLTSYATATGDFSNEGIETVADNFEKHQSILERKELPKLGEASEDPKISLFKASVLPMIVEHWKEKLGKKDNLSLRDMAEISNALAFQCSNNRFMSHSFNGALLPIINEKGLDINNEMFRDEFKTLAKISQSPYKTGELMFCELSSASFGYAVRSPERLWMTIKQPELLQRNNETVGEFARRNAKAMIQDNEGFLTRSESAEVLESANKIINFYYSDAKNCISLINQKVDVPYRDSNGPIISNLINLPNKITLSLSDEDKARYRDCKLSKKEERLDKFDKFLPDLKERYPDLKSSVEAVENASFHDNLMRYGLNNFMHEGYSDGYKIPSGKIERKNLSIATFENPLDMYALRQKQLEINAESVE